MTTEPSARPLTVLFINESSLPAPYTTATVTGREMRLVRDLSFVGKVIALGRGGSDFVSTGAGSPEPGIEVRHYPLLDSGKKGPLFPFVAAWTAWRAMSREPVDILHAESPIWSGPVACVLGRLKRKPVVVEVRYNVSRVLEHHYKVIPASLKRLAVRMLFGLSLKSATVVICNSEFHRREVAALGVPLERIVVVSPGIEVGPETIARIEQARVLRREVPTIGFVGRLEPGKAPRDALLAIGRAQQSVGPLKLIVVGDGSELEALRRQAAEAGLDAEFTGQANVWDWLPRAHLMVNSSLYASALDMVNLEAYVSGIPVVGYGVDGLPETIRDGETGILIEPGNWQALATAIVDLVENPAKRQAMAEAGRRLVDQTYLYSGQVAAMAEAYRRAEVQGGKPAARR